VTETWKPKIGELVRVKSPKVADQFGIVTWVKCSRVSQSFGIVRVLADNRETEVFLSEVEEVT